MNRSKKIIELCKKQWLGVSEAEVSNATSTITLQDFTKHSLSEVPASENSLNVEGTEIPEATMMEFGLQSGACDPEADPVYKPNLPSGQNLDAMTILETITIKDLTKHSVPEISVSKNSLNLKETDIHEDAIMEPVPGFSFIPEAEFNIDLNFDGYDSDADPAYKPHSSSEQNSDDESLGGSIGKDLISEQEEENEVENNQTAAHGSLDAENNEEQEQTKTKFCNN